MNDPTPPPTSLGAEELAEGRRLLLQRLIDGVNEADDAGWTPPGWLADLYEKARPLVRDHPDAHKAMSEAGEPSVVGISFAPSAQPEEGPALAALWQIKAWDNHTHDGDEGREVCPTCFASKVLESSPSAQPEEPRLTEWEQWVRTLWQRQIASGRSDGDWVEWLTFADAIIARLVGPLDTRSDET